MTRPRLRRYLVIAAFVGLAASAGLMAGCGESTADDATTTDKTTTTSQAVLTEGTLEFTTNETQTIVVDGSSTEEYEAALPGLEAAVEATPDDLNALQELAIAQYNTARYQDAAATYQKMLAIKDDAFTRNNYGNVLRDWNKTDEAIAEYRKAIAADPTLTTAYVNLAAVLVRANRADEALALLDQGAAAVKDSDKARLQSYREQISTPTTT